jgi:signal transduction histidine kinase/CheY-like chemotaxis protein
MNAISIPPLVMSSICLFVGIYSLIIHFRRRIRRVDLTFALTAIAAACYGAHCAGLYSAADPLEGAGWQRGQLFILPLLGVAFAWFVADYTGQVPRKALVLLTAVFLVGAAFQLFDRTELTWDLARPHIKHVVLPFGLEVTYNEVTAGPVTNGWALASIAAFSYLMLAAVRMYRRGDRRRSKPLLIAIGIYFATVANDIAVNAGLYSFLYLMEYGFMGLVLLIAYYLSNEVVEAALLKAQQAELQEQLREAQKIEAIGRLAGGIAHDLNNLLTPIVGYSDLALRKERTPEQQRTYFEQIREAAEDARTLTGQLLAFGRRQLLSMRVLDPVEVIGSAEIMLRSGIREDIDLIFELDSGAGNVRADPTQLRQILMNLVINSRDAMPDGGRIVIRAFHVEVDAAYVESHPGLGLGSYAVISVHDNGAGMPEEVASAVFEPFFTTKEKGQGSGLGLATVYGIVKQHGGHVVLRSVPAQGTTVEVYLPTVEAEATASTEPPADWTPFGTGQTVLVVEDEPAVRAMARDVLESHGFAVLEAGGAAEAAAVAAEHGEEIRLLLSDVIMPGTNGRELYQGLVVDHPHLRVLFMSGHDDDVITRHGVLEDGVNFVQKPFTVQSLMQAVGETLGRRPASEG